jgi:hypothetical protein
MKKNVFLWALYDFANSIVMIVFLFYFSQWLVVDSGKPDWWFNATLIMSSLLFILTAPVAGQRLDATGHKLSGVRVTSVIMFVFYFSAALVVLFAPAQAFFAYWSDYLEYYFNYYSEQRKCKLFIRINRYGSISIPWIFSREKNSNKQNFWSKLIMFSHALLLI